MAMSRPVTVFLVDDDARERQQLATHLQKGSLINVVSVPPSANIDAVELDHPDAVLIDYQLSGSQPGGRPATYKGSTLAAVLRAKLPNRPIILMTREQLRSAGRLGPSRDVEGAFDELWIKSAIYDDPATMVATLVDLIRGFALLAKAPKSWAGLRSVLGAMSAEDEALLAADPPAALLEGQTWRVPEAARWIRHTLLRYPGVLYDGLHAATALGVAQDALKRPSVRQSVRRTLYRGPFAAGSTFFWKERLLLGARKLLRDSGLGDNSLTSFARAWRVLHRAKLPLAVCASSGEAPADAVCHVLRSPVMRQYSLPYRPDTRPAVMDPARVSFRAIRESSDYDEWLLAPDSRALARKVEQSKRDSEVLA
jgi:CheY-like chemotaxis protein